MQRRAELESVEGRDWHAGSQSSNAVHPWTDQEIDVAWTSNPLSDGNFQSAILRSC